MTFSGLTLSVPAFSVGGVDFSGGGVDALPNRTQFLVLNLKTRTLHTLGRAIGDGEVVLAQLMTSDSTVTQLTPQIPSLPPTRLPRTLAKLAAGEPLIVHCFGSSLVANGLGAHGWQKLIFDPTYPDARFLVSPKITSTSYAVGGTNSRYTVSLVGQGSSQGQKLKTPAYDCDLAVVALLPNGGEDRLAIFEGVVRQLRGAGLEVLLLTDNAYAGKGEAPGLYLDGEFVRSLAEKYGCALADTAAYMRESELRGVKVYADSIHQTEAGHLCWAEAAAGALTPVSAATAPTVTAGEPLQPAALIPASAVTDFTPETTLGQTTPSALGNRPAQVFNAPQKGSINLEPGATLEVAHPRMLAADLIFDCSSSFTADVRDASGGEILKTITYKAPEKIPPRPQTNAVFSASELKEIADRHYRITVTSGKLILYAVLYQEAAPTP